MSPIFTDSFDLAYKWLNHYTALGVEGYTLYWTASKMSWSRDEHPNLTSAFKPFPYPSATWFEHQHFSTDDRYYYGQTTTYNDCVYRNRHRYTFLLMLDLDEFLVIRDESFIKGHRPLSRLLQKIFPADQAGMAVYRWAYRKDCRTEQEQAEVSSFLNRFTHRQADSESLLMLRTRSFGDKLIVRPNLVHIFYIHWLQAEKPQAMKKRLNVDPELAYVKHLRDHGEDCSELVTDDPPHVP